MVEVSKDYMENMMRNMHLEYQNSLNELKDEIIGLKEEIRRK